MPLYITGGICHTGAEKYAFGMKLLENSHPGWKFEDGELQMIVTVQSSPVQNVVFI